MPMNEDTAISRLSSMVAAGEDPVLDSGELVKLLDMFATADLYGNGTLNRSDATVYAPSTVYVPGNTVRDSAYRFWRATTPGTSSVAFTFPAVLGPTTKIPYFVRDGQIAWQDIGGLWVPTWDLNKAAAEGWRWKAALLANKFDFASDNQQFNLRQKHANALLMVDQYERRRGGTFQVDARSDFASASMLYLLPGA